MFNHKSKCLTIRQEHLELSGDLSTDAFTLALWRFIARWSQPKAIWINEGTNFVGANSELKIFLSNLDHNKLNNTLVNQKIVIHPQVHEWMGPVNLLWKILKDA